MAELYKQFSTDWIGLDYSDQALIDMYNNESFGIPEKHDLLKGRNGYFIGKQWLGVTTNGWKADIETGYLFLFELYEDPRIPDWYLDREFGEQFISKKKRPTLEQMKKDIFG